MTGETGNSGIQYRSVELPDVAKWVMKGYQADIDGKEMFTGQVYEERMRGFLALRGQIVYVPDGEKPGWIGTLGSNDELKCRDQERRLERHGHHRARQHADPDDQRPSDEHFD